MCGGAYSLSGGVAVMGGETNFTSDITVGFALFSFFFYIMRDVSSELNAYDFNNHHFNDPLGLKIEENIVLFYPFMRSERVNKRDHFLKILIYFV